jgi:hypothetical protein
MHGNKLEVKKDFKMMKHFKHEILVMHPIEFNNFVSLKLCFV